MQPDASNWLPGTDPETVKVYTAFIVAAISIVGTVIGATLKVRIETRKLRQNYGAVVESLVARFSMKTWQSTLHLRADGSGVVLRRCLEFKAKEPAPDIRVSYRLLLTRGRLRPPVLSAEPNSVLGFRFDVIVDEPDYFDADVVLNGTLAPTTGFVGFMVKQEIEPAAFCTTEEEVVKVMSKDRFKYEFFGTTVVVPVEELIVEVEFPATYGDLARRSFAVVFYGESEERNVEEETRLQKEKSYSPVGVTGRLRVNKPIRGHHYAIAWMPPPASPAQTP